MDARMLRRKEVRPHPSRAPLACAASDRQHSPSAPQMQMRTVTHLSDNVNAERWGKRRNSLPVEQSAWRNVALAVV